MYCTRCLKILICIAAVSISRNGAEPGNDRLSNDDRMKQRELDYGERLSSMEENPRDGLRGELDRQGAPSGPVRLIGMLNNKKKTLNQEKNDQAQVTKCTTDKPIQEDSDEISPIPDDVTDINTIPNDTTDSNDNSTTADETGNNTGSGGDDSSVTYPSTTESENEVDPDEGPPQDPSKDDDYDATVSTKKYYGPHAIFSPDHYLDDA